MGGSSSIVDFEHVVTEIETAGLLNPQDARDLRVLITVLDTSITDVQTELERQSKLLAQAGYFYRFFQRRLRSEERLREGLWAGLYLQLRATYAVTPGRSRLPTPKSEDVTGRFSEKLVESTALVDSSKGGYQEKLRNCDAFKYYADVFYDLRSAYEDRSRALFELSCNVRQFNRQHEAEES